MPYLLDTTPGEVQNDFRLYRQRFEKLKETRFLTQECISNSMTLKLDAVGNTTTLSVKAPEREMVEYFAAQLRPFVLHRDSISHLNICSKAAQYISHDGLKGWCALARKAYQALMENPTLSGLTVYLADDLPLKPSEIFDLFICAEGPHLFADAAAALDSSREWKPLLDMSFVGLCANLALEPLPMLSDTLGIANGDLSENPLAMAGPTQDRVQHWEEMYRSGRQICQTRFDDARWPIPKVRLRRMLRRQA